MYYFVGPSLSRLTHFRMFHHLNTLMERDDQYREFNTAEMMHKIYCILIEIFIIFLHI
jgi:hypothetical protein